MLKSNIYFWTHAIDTIFFLSMKLEDLGYKLTLQCICIENIKSFCIQKRNYERLKKENQRDRKNEKIVYL